MFRRRGKSTSFAAAQKSHLSECVYAFFIICNEFLFLLLIDFSYFDQVREELSALGDWSSRVKRALEEIPVSQQKREYLTYGLETLRSRLELISRFPSEYDPLLSCSVHLVRKAASDDDDENCGLDKVRRSVLFNFQNGKIYMLVEKCRTKSLENTFIPKTKTTRPQKEY